MKYTADLNTVTTSGDDEWFWHLYSSFHNYDVTSMVVNVGKILYVSSHWRINVTLKNKTKGLIVSLCHWLFYLQI